MPVINLSMKRTLDIIISFTALLFLSPILLILSLMIVRKLGKPVLFCQDRPGLDGKVFKFVKFRSMTDRRDGNGSLLADKHRLTPFGAKLRATSLDELPSLLNVVRGDMSIVGPRPLLPQYLRLYSSHQARRHEVKPGITGWAQINGRNSISWEEKFNLDVWYVDNQSLLLDLTILLKTVRQVLARESINADGQATMPEFVGNPDQSKSKIE